MRKMKFLTQEFFKLHDLTPIYIPISPLLRSLKILNSLFKTFNMLRRMGLKFFVNSSSFRSITSQIRKGVNFSLRGIKSKILNSHYR